MKNEVVLKIALIGDSGVGKTCMIERYVKDSFDEFSDPTKGSASATKVLKASLKKSKVDVMLSIWDTAGQEIYRSLAPFYIKDADGIILVFDVTRHSTYDGLQEWLKMVKENAPSDCALALAGNKSDAFEHEEVDYTSAQKFADFQNAAFFPTSAKENINIREVFLSIVKTKFPSLAFSLGAEESCLTKSSDYTSIMKKLNKKLKSGNKKNSHCCV